MTAPTIESSTDISVLKTTSFNVDLPSGTQAGDLLLAIIAKDDDLSMASSHNFTEAYSIIGADHGTWCFYKIADADDVTRTNVTFTGDSEDYVGRMYRITGFDSGTPIDVVDTTGATGTSDSPQAPSIETVTDDALVFAAAGMDDDDEPYSLDTGGWTTDVNASASSVGIVIGRKVMTSYGATGVVDYTTDAPDGWAATQVAIRPESVGATYEKEYTVDAILKKSDIEKEFTVDAFLQVKDNDKEFTADAILTLVVDKEFTTDALLKKADNDKEFTVDSILKKSDIDKTFTVDAILEEAGVVTYDKTFTVDAILKKTQEKTFTVDAIIGAEVEDGAGGRRPPYHPRRKIIKEYEMDIYAEVIKEKFEEIGIYAPLKIKREKDILINSNIFKETETDLNLLVRIDHRKLKEILDAI